MSEDRCVCCGEIVPEGTMVCINCEKSDQTIYIEGGKRKCDTIMCIKQWYNKIKGKTNVN